MPRPAPSTPTGTRRASRGPDLRVIGAVVAGAALLAVGAVWVVANRSGTSGPAVGPQYGEVHTEGTALPPLPPGGSDPAVGMRAPVISSRRGDRTVTVDVAADGEPTLVVFLAHWCPHCQAELPVLVDLARRGDFEGVRVVAVLTASDPNRPNWPPETWLDREGWSGERFFDDRDSSAATAWGASGFPFLVFVRSDGTVAARMAGEQPPGVILGALSLIRS